jgi:hypothetical protein
VLGGIIHDAVQGENGLFRFFETAVYSPIWGLVPIGKNLLYWWHVSIAPPLLLILTLQVV